jgi:hypothetical protein
MYKVIYTVSGRVQETLPITYPKALAIHLAKVKQLQTKYGTWSIKPI